MEKLHRNMHRFDGARSMSGRFQSIQALVKQNSQHCIWTHCMIQREALASNEMSPCPNIALTTVVTVVNYMKMRIFPHFVTTWAQYFQRYYFIARKFLQPVYELRVEIAIFIEEENRPETENF